MNCTEYRIRPMTIEDYDSVRELWLGIHGFGIRSMDDSREGVERFLKRNPSLSMVAVIGGVRQAESGGAEATVQTEPGEAEAAGQIEPGEAGAAVQNEPGKAGAAELTEERIVGAILCGHDGRRGCLYHVCVHEDFRKRGIGKAMATACMRALRNEGINKVNLIAFKLNEIGNRFLKGEGWEFREDLNYYDFTLNEANITKFNK